MKLISVGMPTYNGEAFIKEAIESLLAQTYSHFELIISDDASTDNTGKICQKFAKKYSAWPRLRKASRRIRYFRQQKRLGIAENFNYVLKKAKGEFFVWAGDDDLWDKDYLQTLHALLTDFPDAVSAVSNYKNLFARKKYVVTKHRFTTQPKNRFESLLHYVKTNNLSYFYGLHRMSFLKKIGGYHKDTRPFFNSSDHLTIFKILLQGRMVFANEVLFYKRDTGLFTQRFTILEKLAFNKRTWASIIRYLTFPLSFLYDFCYSFYYAFRSRLAFMQKCVLAIFILWLYIKRNMDFFLSLIVGLTHVIKGIYRRFVPSKRIELPSYP